MGVLGSISEEDGKPVYTIEQFESPAGADVLSSSWWR
jgi:hypothetical protein